MAFKEIELLNPIANKPKIETTTKKIVLDIGLGLWLGHWIIASLLAVSTDQLE